MSDLPADQLHEEWVVEVRNDLMEWVQFRHTAQFVHWRPDRDLQTCIHEQVDRPVPFKLADVLSIG